MDLAKTILLELLYSVTIPTMKYGFKGVVSFLLLLSLLFLEGTVRGNDGPGGAVLSEEGGRLLDRGLGRVDAGALSNIAGRIACGDLIAALYGESHPRRLVALEVAGYLEDPWPVMKYLIAFLEARERRAASAAAMSLIESLERIAGISDAPEVVPGQVQQMVHQLHQVAKNTSVSRDLKVAALQAVGAMARIFPDDVSPDMKFLDASDEAVRQAALSLLELPLGEQALEKIADVATGDDSVALRSQAVALLCENALGHGVTTPSADLQGLIEDVFVPENEARNIAPTLGCLVRFPPESRARFIGTLHKHPDPRLLQFWEMLQEP